MIDVKLFRSNGKIVKVSARGHSGLAGHGNDILCAAVSAIVQTAYLAACDIVGKEIEYTRDPEIGLFEFSIAPNITDRHDIDVILRAMCVGLQDLMSGYPQNLKLEEA